jgi:hypothetical protein
MTNSASRIFRIFLISALACTAPALAQSAQKPTPPVSTKDATWTREYATNGKDIKWDTRFIPLLKASFPQHQWFWYDHYKSTSLPDLIQTFLGVSGSALLDEDRYVTADGCVPHDCVANRGMLWIDTGTQPATLIFAATNLVSGNGPEGYHLWIFSSTKLNWQHLPPWFSVSLPRWLTTIAKPGYRGTSGYHYKFALATIVQPNGVMEDITPETLPLGITEIGTTKTGAKQ